MKTPNHSVLFWSMILAIVQLNGCSFLPGTHRTFSRSESKRHFHQWQGEFEALGADWVAHHHEDDLAYRPWNKGEVRWNGTSIFQDGSGYLVSKGAHKGVGRDSFSAAARLAGADPADLTNWVSSLKKLNVALIYVVGTKESSSKQFIQIGLQEAGADYGYLYVPPGHEEAQTLVLAAAQKQPGLIGMECVEQIAPQWFYFEGKGAL